MSDIQQSVDFKAIIAQTSAVLLTRGVEVEPVAVRDVVALMVRSFAERMNMDPEEALHLVRPESVTEAITAAADPDREGAEHVYAVRPVRVDASTVAVPVRALGRLVMAAADEVDAGMPATLRADAALTRRWSERAEPSLAGTP